jgi:hypothetical protein
MNLRLPTGLIGIPFAVNRVCDRKSVPLLKETLLYAIRMAYQYKSNWLWCVGFTDWGQKQTARHHFKFIQSSHLH